MTSIPSKNVKKIKSQQNTKKNRIIHKQKDQENIKINVCLKITKPKFFKTFQINQIQPKIAMKNNTKTDKLFD